MLYVIGSVIFTIIFTRKLGYRNIWSYIWRSCAFSIVGIGIWITFGCMIGWLFPQHKVIFRIEEICSIDDAGNYFMISSNNSDNTIYHYCSLEDGGIRIREIRTDKNVTITRESDKAELITYMYEFDNESNWQYLIAMPRAYETYEFRLP